MLLVLPLSLTPAHKQTYALSGCDNRKSRKQNPKKEEEGKNVNSRRECKGNEVLFDYGKKGEKG